ncbi:MAG: ATP phosphoribosyltransferase [Chloroflexota bacterium]
MTRKFRLGLPKNDRLARATLDFLQACDLKVTQKNPRLYIGHINTMPGLETWFQRKSDIVRQVREGVLDLGLAGYDTVLEYQGKHDQIVVIHDALGYSHCTLEIVVPQAWQDVNTIQDLVRLGQARPKDTPLRVASTYQKSTTQFLADWQIPHHYLKLDGAVEAAPQMGTADFIVDIVQTGLTMRENHLKTIEGGEILQSQVCLFGNRQALQDNAALVDMTRQILERIEAHLRAKQHYNLIANVKGESAEQVAKKLHQFTDLAGLQGPTIAPIYPPVYTDENWFAISVMVKKDRLQTAIQQLRQIGGSGVVALPALFIFDETPERWQTFKQTLEVS